MDNEKIIELTKEQMEKVSGCGRPDSQGQGYDPGPTIGTDCYRCPGIEDDGITQKPCGHSLQHVSGKLYRCTNPFCSLLGHNQYPAGK